MYEKLQHFLARNVIFLEEEFPLGCSLFLYEDTTPIMTSANGYASVNEDTLEMLICMKFLLYYLTN